MATRGTGKKDSTQWKKNQQDRATGQSPRGTTRLLAMGVRTFSQGRRRAAMGNSLHIALWIPGYGQLPGG